MANKRLLVVVDMQNDFVYNTDVLGSEMAQAIVANIKDKIEEYISNGDQVVYTRDTHTANYLATQEGKKLPVPHCIHGTEGWCVIKEIEHPECLHIDKRSFGYTLWSCYANLDEKYNSIELCGVCTDICVVSNALILKSIHPETPMVVDAACCAGTSYEAHAAALKVMESCQIDVINKSWEN